MLAAAVRFGGGFSADCRKCPPSRKAWRGCEEPAPAPVLRITCPECGGVGCASCLAGRLEIFRCPGATVPALYWELCRDLSLLEGGILPGPGGWLDQPQSWIEALDLLAGERAEAEEERRRKPRE